MRTKPGHIFALLLAALLATAASTAYDQAMAAFTEAISLAENPEHYRGRAQVYRALGDEVRAASDERMAQERQSAIDAEVEATE